MIDYEILSVNTDSNTVDCLKFGSGERAFVIIPGLSVKSVLLSASAVVNAYGEFAKDYTCYLFDRPKDMPYGTTVADIAEETAKAMAKLGISDADVFGTSQGGMIAQVIAIEHPELVRKLALGSSAARLHDYALEATANWRALAEQGRAEDLCRDFVNRVYSKPFAEKYGNMLVRLMRDCTEEELSRFATCSHASDGFDITNELTKIKCPVFVIGADNDRVLTGEASREIADILQCEIYMYGEPYGHAVYDEAPDYRQKLLNFYGKEGA
ncbi:MAG: alpha/beta hydrolase [Eubacterium sp.]|nr:alpha/beta hydrolase [Eubacterium sp.]